MIARSGVLLLERCLVFLVDDDQSEMAEGQKHCRTGTKYHVVRLVGDLLLPYLHTLGIAIARMIDAQSRTEHTLQAACHLHREGYFGQQIEHLAALVDGFLNEMDVYFGLAARRDTMQQHHILAHKLHSNLVHGVLLCLAKRLDVLGRVFSPTPYASHFTMIHLKKTSRRELAQYGIGGVGGILQFVASHFLYMFGRRLAVNLVPVRQLKILAEGLLLLQRMGQCGHGDVQRMLCAQIGWQRHAAHCLRTVAVFSL